MPIVRVSASVLRMLMLDHGTSISTNHWSSVSRTACSQVASQSRSNLFWFVTRPSRTPSPRPTANS